MEGSAASRQPPASYRSPGAEQSIEERTALLPQVDALIRLDVVMVPAPSSVASSPLSRGAGVLKSPADCSAFPVARNS